MAHYDRYRRDWRERLRALAWITYFMALFVALLWLAILVFW
jgi:hypothetical protein